MNQLLPILLLGLTCADLGVITPKRSLILTPADGWADFAYFVLTVKAHGYQTNDVVITNKTSFITEDILRAVPEGPAKMEVYTIHTDGEKSEVYTNTFTLRRTKPHKPIVETITGPFPTIPSAYVTTQPLPDSTRTTSYTQLHRSQTLR